MDRMLARFVDELLETAHVPETLDEAAQAEAWASGAVAEWMELGGDPVDLASTIEASASFPAMLVRWIVDGVVPTAGPDWLGDLAAQEPVEAWRLAASTANEGDAGDGAHGSGEVALIVEYEAPSQTRHALSVTLADGRLVDCGVGPAGLAEAAGEDDADAMVVSTLAVDDALAAITPALRAADPAELTVNGRLNLPLALRRFGVELAPGAVASSAESLPIPPRDEDDDAWAADLVRSALRLHDAAPSLDGAPPEVTAAASAFAQRWDDGDADARTVGDVAGVHDGVDDVRFLRAAGAYLRPVDVSVHPVATQEAILELEWADWLGAILGLTRSEAGTEVDGATLVRLINRCPEITTTIPKQDAGRIGWAFEQTMYAWAVTGILDEDGCLTDAGRWLLPRVALAAWTAQPDG